MRTVPSCVFRTGAWLLALATLPTCTKGSYIHLYATQPFAPSYTAADVAALNHLGATIVDNGINFSVYSERATKMQVLLFDAPDEALPAQQFDMTPQGQVWNVFVSGIGLHQIYGYVAWGPNWPYDPNWKPGTITGFQADVDSAGNRFNPNKLLFDPWARMATGPFNWSQASAASGPDRSVSTYQAAGKAITVQSTYSWSSNESQWIAARQNPNMPGHRWQDQIVYEAHPKGFTASTASGVTHPGTFRGIGENVAYLKDLGITAVELMPSFWKSTDGGYWGYDTIGFFIPELTYVAGLDPTNPEAAIDEFKWMVDQLHQAGIEIYMDVVFNHTGEGGLWRDQIQRDDVPPLSEGSLNTFDPKEVASVLEFRGIDNQAYYSLSQDYQTYWDNSGVGQDTRANHAPIQRLILDSLHYWVEEMHVDGFRFDEAAVLGEEDLNYNSFDATGSVLQTIANDKVLQGGNIRLAAEPWSGGGDYNGSYPASTTTPGYGWGEWNGPFRDWWRSLMNCDGSRGPWLVPQSNYPGQVGSCPVDSNGNPVTWTFSAAIYCPVSNVANGGFLIFGSQPMFQPNGREPYHSFNYVTIHDGFTMYDVFSFNQKVNGCGPLNPSCCTQPFTNYCVSPDGTDNNLSRDWGQGAEDVKRALMRNLFVAMMVSHGTPLLLGGDEWMRTQLGNNNAYSTLADNSNNWFDWGTWLPDPHRNRMHDFVRQLIALRKTYAYALAPADWTGGAPLSWEDNIAGSPANWNSRHLAVHYPPNSFGREIDILLNFESAALDFTLPSGTWVRRVDTQTYYDEDTYFTQNSSLNPSQSANISLTATTPIPGTDYMVQPQSIVILENTASGP
jgi:isoamylase